MHTCTSLISRACVYKATVHPCWSNCIPPMDVGVAAPSQSQNYFVALGYLFKPTDKEKLTVALFHICCRHYIDCIYTFRFESTLLKVIMIPRFIEIFL